MKTTAMDQVWQNDRDHLLHPFAEFPRFAEAGSRIFDRAEGIHVYNADAFPLDATEWLDSDTDGIGNNADLDDDNDGLTDMQESELGTDPLSRDTDGDGWSDKEEIDEGTDPLAASSQPEVQAGLPVWLLYMATQ
jgi:hypothetical protein